MKKFSKFALAFLSLGLLTACSGPAVIDFTGGEKNVVTSISFAEAALEMEIGDEVTLEPVIEAESTDYSVYWATSNRRIASVNNGVVKAVNSGTAVITAIAGNKNAICRITVKGGIVVVDVTHFALNNETYTMTAGSSTKLSYTTVPENAEIAPSWESSDPTVAAVGLDGTITALKAGTCTITASYASFHSTCELTVNENQGGGGEFTLTLNETAKTLVVGATYQLTATPSTAATVTWRSGDGRIATVSANGLVTAVAAGSAQIIATANGVDAVCIITVTTADIGDRDPDVEIYFFIDFNNYDLNEPYAKIDWYSEVPLTQEVLPATPTTAPDPAFPYFAGWSDHTIIDTKEDLWDLATDVVPLGVYFLALYGIWSDVEDFNL